MLPLVLSWDSGSCRLLSSVYSYLTVSRLRADLYTSLAGFKLKIWCCLVTNFWIEASNNVAGHCDSFDNQQDAGSFTFTRFCDYVLKNFVKLRVHLCDFFQSYAWLLWDE
ncbi:hypothetical protein SAY86_007868 [Trapa natans]|uniref:Uncharacterized protein n=1 Tax=Trapa natans TaxID=22666 RepID=A0AAN7LFV4_TRANT|nr:hypothetical protein SAY86_007868 [Trapa natans]